MQPRQRSKSFGWSWIVPLLLTCHFTHAQTPACTPADVESSLHIYEEPDSIERITPVTQNASGHDCLLSEIGQIRFAPDRPEIRYCQGCAHRLPGGADLETLPLLLKPGAIAHQSFRYRTSASSSSPGCVQVESLQFGGTYRKPDFSLASRSLLKPICSQVDIVGYRPGSVNGSASDGAPGTGEPELMLDTGRSTYYAGETFYLRTNPKPLANGTKPVLLTVESAPTGEIRIQEVRLGVLCMGGNFSHKYAYMDGPFLQISPGDCSGLSALGQYTFRILQLDGTDATGEIHFLRSRPLQLRIEDPTTIARAWGETREGVRADLTLDKTQFQLGEDFTAHIATQTFQGGVAAYSLHLSITDADGPIENSERPGNLDKIISIISAITCSEALEAGKVIPLETSLRDHDMLPRRPGTYVLSVIWNPRRWNPEYCGFYHLSYAAASPFVTVTSKPITITVVGTPPPTKLRQFPEYTAWRAHFRFVDTTFGPKTALRDRATGLEWLRPAITAGSDVNNYEEFLKARMAKDRDLAGWRFASRDEVRKFLAHFTRSPNGSSQDPAVARKLLRLLGGTLNDQPSPGSEWFHSGVSVNIGGATPVGARIGADGKPLQCDTCGPGFLRYRVFVDEMEKGDDMRVTIDPANQPSQGKDKRFIGNNDGFFLVRTR